MRTAAKIHDGENYDSASGACLQRLHSQLYDGSFQILDILFGRPIDTVKHQNRGEHCDIITFWQKMLLK